MNLMVGGLQIKIRCLRYDGMAALEVGNRATTVAEHAGRARSTGKKEDQLSQDINAGAVHTAPPGSLSRLIDREARASS